MCSSGLSALLLVALQGASLDQLQRVEFGRGFGYNLPLSISMPSVGSTILKQIVSVWFFRLTRTPTQTLNQTNAGSPGLSPP